MLRAAAPGHGFLPERHAYAEYRARREKDGGKFDQEDARDDAYFEVPAAAPILDVSRTRTSFWAGR